MNINDIQDNNEKLYLLLLSYKMNTHRLSLQEKLLFKKLQHSFYSPPEELIEINHSLVLRRFIVESDSIEKSKSDVIKHMITKEGLKALKHDYFQSDTLSRIFKKRNQDIRIALAIITILIMSIGIYLTNQNNGATNDNHQSVNAINQSLTDSTVIQTTINGIDTSKTIATIKDSLVEE